MAQQQILQPKSEYRATALPISDGIACGPAHLVLRESGEYVPRYHIAATEIPKEKARLSYTLEIAANNLNHVIHVVEERVGRVQANIFLAQKMIIQDEALKEEACAIIEKQRLNAETACTEVLDSYESRLLEVDNDYLKDRASDIGEVRRRILEAFRKESGAKEFEHISDADTVEGPRIIVAEELLPGETVALNTTHTAGFLTERGGSASHVAILARAMGIPAVSGIPGLMQRVRPGDHILINGTTGELVINPTRQTLNLYPALGRSFIGPRMQTAPPVPGFNVLANINTAQEVETALAMEAEGIGLYRTEFEFILEDRILTEEEQFERYAHVVRQMNGKPVYMRLADLGGEKAARFLKLPAEDNPALGYRGARLLLGQPELLGAQARAIARASQYGPIHVIYPMIVDEQQFLKLRTLFLQSISDLTAGNLQHGIMFEVPSACICAESLLAEADFGSIGTNDLVQYLYAVDRDNGLVSEEYDSDKPAFWKMVEHIAASAAATHKPLSVCGEMGGQPKYLPKLIAAGIRRVSVSPRLVGLARVTARRAQHLFNA